MTAGQGKEKHFENYSDNLRISWAKEGVIEIIVEKPEENMQSDAADFEAVALMCKCVLPDCRRIEIGFEHQHLKWNRKYGEQNSNINNYLRFLYRLDMFQRAFPDWVSISQSVRGECEAFVDLLKNAEPSNNIPEQKADKDPKKGREEHKIEIALVHNERGRAYLNELYLNAVGGRLLCAHNQLPNGLFDCGAEGVCSEKNRIFSTGFYDLWGLDDQNNFCVFELKKDEDNEHLGVISQLFFYAAYARDILINPDRLHQKKQRNNFRGYEELYDAVAVNASVKSVRALFLLGRSIHPLIEENKEKLIELLNSNTFGIHFDIIRYDYERLKNILTE